MEVVLFVVLVEGEVLLFGPVATEMGVAGKNMMVPFG